MQLANYHGLSFQPCARWVETYMRRMHVEDARSPQGYGLHYSMLRMAYIILCYSISYCRSVCIWYCITLYTSGGLKCCAVCSHGGRPNEKSNELGPEYPSEIITIQRRLAWPLCKDDTHKSRSANNCLRVMNTAPGTPEGYELPGSDNSDDSQGKPAWHGVRIFTTFRKGGCSGNRV